MNVVLDYLQKYTYFAIFGILFLCGLGLPIPEEVTLIGSGLIVGLGQADFYVASTVCVFAIIVGDSIPFFLGRFYGQRFLSWMLSPERLEKAKGAFEGHRLKTVFFARFVAGFRIPVYAYAGANKMSWFTFAFFDFLGAMISGPTSVWLGKYAMEKVTDGEKDPKLALEKAVKKAQDLSGEFHNWLLLLVGIAAVVFILLQVHKWVNRRMLSSAKTDESNPSEPSAATTPDGGLSDAETADAETPERSDNSKDES